jgi:hypothetical protein
MMKMKRRSFGSIGGRVDATFFFCLYLSLSASLARGVVARVCVIREGAPCLFGFLKNLGFVVVSLKPLLLGLLFLVLETKAITTYRDQCV